MTVAELEVIITGRMDRLERELQEAKRKAGKAGEDAGKSFADRWKSGLNSAGNALSLAVTLPLVAAAKKSIDAARDLAESQSKATVVFKDSTRIVEDFASKSATAFGIARQAALEYSATFGTILEGSGVASDAAAVMSKNLVSLAADLASFNNISIDDALVKLRAGIVGEIEPLRSVGVLLSEDAVKREAVRKGIAKQGEQLTDQQKVLARYMLIMEQTKLQQGDFARTSGGLANQQRIVAAEVQDLAAKFGKDLLPVAKDLISVTRDGVKWFTSLDETQRRNILRAAAFAAALGPVLKGISNVWTVTSALVGTGKSVIGWFRAWMVGAQASGNALAVWAAGLAKNPVIARVLGLAPAAAVAAIGFMGAQTGGHSVDTDTYGDTYGGQYAQKLFNIQREKGKDAMFRSLENMLSGQVGGKASKSLGALNRKLIESTEYGKAVIEELKSWKAGKEADAALAKATADAEKSMAQAAAGLGSGSGSKSGKAKKQKEENDQVREYRDLIRELTQDLAIGAGARQSAIIQYQLLNGQINAQAAPLARKALALALQSEKEQDLADARKRAEEDAKRAEEEQINRLRRHREGVDDLVAGVYREVEAFDKRTNVWKVWFQLKDKAKEGPLSMGQVFGALKSAGDLDQKSGHEEWLKRQRKLWDDIFQAAKAYGKEQQKLADEKAKKNLENYNEYMADLAKRLSTAAGGAKVLAFQFSALWAQFGGGFDGAIRALVAMDKTLNVEKLEEYQKSLQDIVSTGTEAFMRMFDSLEKDGFDRFFSNVMTGFRRMIADMAKEWLYSQIRNLVSRGISHVLGGVGLRASGGPVMENRAYLVGEHGPEMFVPTTGGSVVSAKDTERRMAGPSVVVNVVVNTPDVEGFRRSKSQIAAEMARAMDAARRRNG